MGVRVARVLIALALALTARAGAADPPEKISLRFNWPSPLALRVQRTFTRTEQRPDGKPPPTLRSTTTYIWRGARSGDAYRVAFTDFRVIEPEPKPRSSDALIQLEHMTRAIEPLLPTLVVRDASEPPGVEDLAGVSRRINQVYQSIPGLNDDPVAARMAKVLVSEEVLSQRAQQDWNAIVQAWAGAEADLGRVQEIEGSTATRADAVQNLFRYSIERRMPCASPRPQPACVRLVTSQR